MSEQNGLSDPRETYPEEGDAYATHEPPDRIELLAALLKETRRIEKQAAWAEQADNILRRRLRDKEERLDALTERVVRAERALVEVERREAPLPAAVYLETLDDQYVAYLRSENDEARA